MTVKINELIIRARIEKKLDVASSSENSKGADDGLVQSFGSVPRWIATMLPDRFLYPRDISAVVIKSCTSLSISIRKRCLATCVMRGRKRSCVILGCLDCYN